ncbi:mediator of RNA polymerase II transcription subunit 15a-like [Argentina anserina]|uniref:mediator of RNA polymerase II transcription subunit 15a-like n=1 Tax=Argentina anserina TaxID=57926 RepID=UPI0021763E6D|nr:mediator of RNA polymerase II transcription subunit 15a-like [Potentilla anserina]
MRQRKIVSTQKQNQSTGLDFLQQQRMLAYQQNDTQQRLHGQNINLSGLHHVQMRQAQIFSTQQQILERQLNSSQEERMQRQQTQVEQYEQQTHQMAGMPASKLLREGEVYQRVQTLRCKYIRELTVVYQRLTYCLQNIDIHNIQKLEVVKSLYQKVEIILKMLNMAEFNITPIMEEQLELLERKIRYTLHRCRHEQPVSALEHEKLSSDVHDRRQFVQPDSRTLQAQTNQVEKKPPLQTKNLESSGQQVAKHTSQSEKNNLSIHLAEARTPLNSITSPSRSSSLAPKVSLPVPVESEKPMSDTPSHFNAGNIEDEQVKGAQEAPTLSTLLLDKSNDDVHSNKSTVDSNELQPIQKLLKVVNSMSYKALGASASYIASVVCRTDRMKMKRPRSTLPIIDAASESGICHMMKRPRLEVNQTLFEEIRAISQRLINTVLDISDQETARSVKTGRGTVVRCSFVGVAISLDLMSSTMFQLQPLRLLVPPSYPLCSPIFLDKLTVQVGYEPEDLSAKVMSKLSRYLRTIEEPLSLGEIANDWDTCAREVLCEHAQQIGGGTFSSKYGTWEDCLTTA